MVNNVNFGNGYNLPRDYSKDLDALVKYQMGTPSETPDVTQDANSAQKIAIGLGTGAAGLFFKGHVSINDIENLSGYVVGTNIAKQSDGPFSGMGIMLGIGGAMEAYKGAKWAKNNWGHLGEGWQKGMDTFHSDLAFKKELFENGGWKNIDTYKNLWNRHSAKTVLDCIPEESKLAKLVETPEVLKAKAAYEKARKAANLAKEANGTRASKLLQYADAKLAEGRFLAHGQVGPAEKGIGGFFSKIGKAIGKWTGFSKANGAIKELAVKSPTTAKVLKFGKGNGIFLAITGAVELFTQVIPSFTQLGAAKGSKQLVKSTVKTGASVGGWAAGAAIGGAIGSVIPGAGTIIGGAIGALCGLAGGMIGSWAATKGAEAIVGKNELDIAKEEQAQKLTQQAKKDPRALQQLMAAAGQKLQTEGVDTPDGKTAFGSLSKLTAKVKNNEQEENYRRQQYLAKLQQYGTNQNSFGNNQYTPYASNNMYGMNNPYAAKLYGQNNNFMGQQDYKDMDFMAMNAGLIQA